MKLSASILLLTLAAASPEMRYFRYQRPLQNLPPTNGQSCLTIDPAIFAHSAASLTDLRLYRDGTETPFVLRTDAPAETVQSRIEPLNLGQRDGHTVFDAVLPESPYADIDLNLDAKNFIATVTVIGSQAKTGGALTRIGSFTVFDLTGQKLGRSTVLHLPQSDFRYLHFQINDALGGPLAPKTVTGLSVERVAETQPRYVTVADSATGGSQIVQKGRSTVLEFTVPAHVPVDRVVFTPGAAPALFSRDVTVSVTPIPTGPATDTAAPPQSVESHGNLLRVHSVQNGQRIDEEDLTVAAPSANFDTPARWTVTIDNGDDPPLGLQSVRLEMLQRNLCFEAAANAAYTLFYGDAALDAPRYDYASLFAAQPHPAQLAAGAESLNANYQSRPDERPFTEKHPALLWVALVGVIALLGVVALKTAKPAAQSPK